MIPTPYIYIYIYIYIQGQTLPLGKGRRGRRDGCVVIMGRVSVPISYSFRCLTTKTVKYINENSFIENLAASK